MRALLALTGLVLLALPAVTAAPVPVVERCVFLVDFPDNGHGVCVDSDGPCFLAYARTTFAGEQRVCMVPPGA